MHNLSPNCKPFLNRLPSKRRLSSKRSSSKRISNFLAKKMDSEAQQLFNSYKIEQIEELREIFKMYDRDNTGNISSRTLKFLLRGLGDNVNEEEVDVVLKDMDEDGNGMIDFQEFLLYMLEKVNAQSLEDDIVDVFKVLDKDCTGYLTTNDLHILTKGKKCEALVEEFCYKGDLDCEGEIKYKDYIGRILK
jgi:calmodulin